MFSPSYSKAVKATADAKNVNQIKDKDQTKCEICNTDTIDSINISDDHYIIRHPDLLDRCDVCYAPKFSDYHYKDMSFAELYYYVVSKEKTDNKPNTESINDVINETVKIAIAKIKEGLLIKKKIHLLSYIKFVLFVKLKKSIFCDITINRSSINKHIRRNHQEASLAKTV